MPHQPVAVPPTPWLTQFHKHWKESPSRVFIRDLETHEEATPTEFLYEVLAQRDRIWASLSAQERNRIQDPSEEVFIAIIARAGFELAVLLFAVHALGGIAVPLRFNIHLDEARYFLGTCNAVLITSSQLAAPHAESISSSMGIRHISFQPSFKEDDIPQTQFELSTDNTFPEYNPSRAFSLLYTSGTTGSPKGVLSSCGATVKGMEYYMGKLALSSKDNWLLRSPVHWKGGFDFLLAAVWSGGGVEFANSVFSPGWFWERMRLSTSISVDGSENSDSSAKPITSFLGPPALLISLKETLDQIEDRDRREYELCLAGLRNLRFLLSGSMRVPESMKEVWRELLPGRELVNMYGFTEISGMVAMPDWRAERVPADNCGAYSPDTIVKISDDGEICVKGERMMIRYISSDPSANSNAFDTDGFYKTGDLGRITADGEVLVFGRASQDVIRTNCYKLNSSDVEDPLRSYPGISQPFVLGVDDASLGQRVAALLLQRTTPGSKPTAEAAALSNLSLADLRRWLAVEKGIPAFKLPALLRVLPQDEFRGTTDNGKPSKRVIARMYFDEGAVERGEVQVWDFKIKEDFTGRAWDWDGRPR
ncbi:hypothetical protein BDV18DRAFT_161829 [Aspergillus unguis]